MNVLMLGWEYPPHIAGGLGIACEGLTKGLSRQGLDVTFVVPRLRGGEDAQHMNLTDQYPEAGSCEVGAGPEGTVASVRRVGIPAFLKPYWTDAEFRDYVGKLTLLGENPAPEGTVQFPLPPVLREKLEIQQSAEEQGEHYGGDIFCEIARFTSNVVSQMADADFSLIHMHDWMTFPAGVALKQISGRPLVAHIHSVEFDRSGENVNPHIHEIEGLGLRSADTVIAVSHYTKQVVNREYGVPLDRIRVVHNGIYPKKVVNSYRKKHNWPEYVVLFLGRVTFQKGPDYFVRAAAKVIEHVPDVLFVLAGSGDLLPRVAELARELKIEDYFHFPGFLKGDRVEEFFSAADLYVMPSVSEPFGISALEAVNFDTPALISRQSGVAEVLGNALKFDFWDVDRLADLIINGLLHEELRAEMVARAKDELRRLHWDASAEKTYEVYRSLLGEQPDGS